MSFKRYTVCMNNVRTLNWVKSLFLASLLAFGNLLMGCTTEDDPASTGGVIPAGVANQQNSGGGSTGVGNTNNPSDPIRSQQIVLTVSPSVLPTDNSQESEVNVLVTDPVGQVAGFVQVFFSLNSPDGGFGGGAFRPAGAILTDEDGRATIFVSTPGNQVNRTIRVRAEVRAFDPDNPVFSEADIQVSGTQLLLEGPAAITQGEIAEFTARLVDAGGGGINNVLLDATSFLANPITSATGIFRTNEDGEVRLLVDAQNGGRETLTVTADAFNLTARRSFIDVTQDRFRFENPEPGTEIPIRSAAGDGGTVVVFVWETPGQTGFVPVVGRTVNFSASIGSIASSAVTDSTGRIQLEITSNAIGLDTIRATAQDGNSQITAELPVEFVAGDVAFIDIQAQPANIDINRNNTSNNTSEIIAVVEDSGGNRVKGVTVNFTLEENPSNGTLSPGSAITDSLGIARTRFRAGPLASGNDGQVIVGTAIGNNGEVAGLVRLTVGGVAIRLALSSNNRPVEVDNGNDDIPNQRNELPYIVTVEDSSGEPINNARVDLTISFDEYFKGVWIFNDTLGRWILNFTSPACPNEDSNLDGDEQPGEDINNNGVLDPQSGTVTSTPFVITDATGTAAFSVIYPKSEGDALKVRLTGRTVVQNTEFFDNDVFLLQQLIEDVNVEEVQPPGVFTNVPAALVDPNAGPNDPDRQATVSPFGFGQACTDPN